MQEVWSFDFSKSSEIIAAYHIFGNDSFIEFFDVNRSYHRTVSMDIGTGSLGWYCLGYPVGSTKDKIYLIKDYAQQIFARSKKDGTYIETIPVSNFNGDAVIMTSNKLFYTSFGSYFDKSVKISPEKMEMIQSVQQRADLTLLDPLTKKVNWNQHYLPIGLAYLQEFGKMAVFAIGYQSTQDFLGGKYRWFSERPIFHEIMVYDSATGSILTEVGSQTGISNFTIQSKRFCVVDKNGNLKVYRFKKL